SSGWQRGPRAPAVAAETQRRGRRKGRQTLRKLIEKALAAGPSGLIAALNVHFPAQGGRIGPNDSGMAGNDIRRKIEELADALGFDQLRPPPLPNPPPAGGSDSDDEYNPTAILPIVFTITAVRHIADLAVKEKQPSSHAARRVFESEMHALVESVRQLRG